MTTICSSKLGKRGRNSDYSLHAHELFPPKRSCLLALGNWGERSGDVCLWSVRDRSCNFDTPECVLVASSCARPREGSPRHRLPVSPWVQEHELIKAVMCVQVFLICGVNCKQTCVQCGHCKSGIHLLSLTSHTLSLSALNLLFVPYLFNTKQDHTQ